MTAAASGPTKWPKFGASRLDAAPTAADVDAPGFRLHPLKGELKGFWAVDVFDNWRIIFRFEKGDALHVDLLDYH